MHLLTYSASASVIVFKSRWVISSINFLFDWYVLHLWFLSLSVFDPKMCNVHLMIKSTDFGGFLNERNSDNLFLSIQFKACLAALITGETWSIVGGFDSLSIYSFFSSSTSFIPSFLVTSIFWSYFHLLSAFSEKSNGLLLYSNKVLSRQDKLKQLLCFSF